VKGEVARIVQEAKANSELKASKPGREGEEDKDSIEYGTERSPEEIQKYVPVTIAFYNSVHQSLLERSTIFLPFWPNFLTSWQI
jgi:hypothetical protein